MSQEALRASVQRLLDIPAEGIAKAADGVGFDTERAERLKRLLHQRRADLATRAELSWDQSAGS